MKTKHVKHLFSRVGFGISPKELKQYSKLTKKAVVNQLFIDSETVTPLQVDISEFDDFRTKEKKITPELLKLSREKLRDFSVAWFERFLNPTEVLREKMVLFWTNHFVCQNNNILFFQQYNQVLRENALGNFGDFTKAISKQAAMLNYLNNRQNVKGSPNENFARELMELFMLGQNQYTEKDIKESARAFTGYKHNFDGDFLVAKFQHDEDEKEFFGKKGNFNGDDIIDIILEKKECAQFICTKLYRFFVNEIPNEEHINELAAIFYKDYNIANVVKYMVLTDWFYDAENIGVKIKSPIEFVAGIYKTVPFEFTKKNQVLFVQNLLGQNLLYPPNVSGWKTGKYWIDSNTMVTRLRLPSMLLNNAVVHYSNLDVVDFEDQPNLKLNTKNTFFKTTPNWEAFYKDYKTLTNSELLEHLLMVKINKQTLDKLTTNTKIPLKEFCVQIMSIPEYQLC